MELDKKSGIDPKLIKKAYVGAKSIMKKKSKGKVPKGYHMMPDGTIMKDSAHKKNK